MRSIEALKLLNDGKIAELKVILEDEVYQDSLKTNPSAKKRYTAMKKYFSYVDQTREVLQKPCDIEFEGEPYTCFTNSWSLALTSEDIGEIELFDREKGNYPDITRLIRFDGLKKKIDFNKVIAEAKSKGYRLNKGEFNHNFKYLMYYDKTYYKIGLIDITYGIINNGKEAMTYHPTGPRMPLTIKNDIGLCIIMPVKFENEPEDYIVIEIE